MLCWLLQALAGLGRAQHTRPTAKEQHPTEVRYTPLLPLKRDAYTGMEAMARVLTNRTSITVQSHSVMHKQCL